MPGGRDMDGSAKADNCDANVNGEWHLSNLTLLHHSRSIFKTYVSDGR